MTGYHVTSIRLDVLYCTYMLTFFTQFRNGFFIKRPICCSPSSRETCQALLGFVYVTMRQNKYDQVDLHAEVNPDVN